MKIITQFTDGDAPVTLEQAADGTFRVTYDLSVQSNLAYTEAARLYGLGVMCSLTCAGKLERMDLGQTPPEETAEPDNVRQKQIQARVRQIQARVRQLEAQLAQLRALSGPVVQLFGHEAN